VKDIYSVLSFRTIVAWISGMVSIPWRKPDFSLARRGLNYCRPEIVKMFFYLGEVKQDFPDRLGEISPILFSKL
jgi:hypothetical protein